MKFFRSSILPVLAFGLLMTSLPVAAQEADPRPEFIQRVKTLADAGTMANPAAVAAVLGMDWRVETTTAPSDCYGSQARQTSTTTRYTAEAGAWYRVLPDGVRNMPLPAVFINPASASSDAELDYKIVRHDSCPVLRSEQERVEAVLRFGGLPSFACFSPQDVKRMLPGGEMSLATDGFSFYVYKGKVDDDSGTRLSFEFRFGAPCALSAEIRQTGWQGLRFARASARYDNCRIRVQRAFCSAREPFGWNNLAETSALRQAIDKTCVSVFRFYREDREQGTQPEPAALQFESPRYMFPCEPLYLIDH